MLRCLAVLSSCKHQTVTEIKCSRRRHTYTFSCTEKAETTDSLQEQPPCGFFVFKPARYNLHPRHTLHDTPLIFLVHKLSSQLPPPSSACASLGKSLKLCLCHGGEAGFSGVHHMQLMYENPWEPTAGTFQENDSERVHCLCQLASTFGNYLVLSRS